MSESTKVCPASDLMMMLGRWINEKEWYLDHCGEQKREDVAIELETLRSIFRGVINNGGLSEENRSNGEDGIQ